MGSSRCPGILDSWLRQGQPGLTQPECACLVPRALKAPEVTKERLERLARGA